MFLLLILCNYLVVDPPGPMGWTNDMDESLDLHSLMARVRRLVVGECEVPSELCCGFGCNPLPAMPGSAVADRGHLALCALTELARDWHNLINLVRSIYEGDCSLMLHGCGGLPRHFDGEGRIVAAIPPLETHEHKAHGKNVVNCRARHVTCGDNGVSDARFLDEVDPEVWRAEVCYQMNDLV